MLVIAIIAASGLLVLLLRSLGADEPAPGVSVAAASTEDPASSRGGTGGDDISRANGAVDSAEAGPATTAAPTAPADSADSALRTQDWARLLGVEPRPTGPSQITPYLDTVSYTDLTADGQDEAIVLVRTPGTGSYRSYYIYGYADGAPVLLFSRQDVKSGQIAPGPLTASFVETEPVYAAGDPECCPSQLKQTTYTWAASARVFIETKVETVPAA